MLILDLIFGFLLVFAGRNLFWLCVGIIGFLTGMQCVALFGLSHGWMLLLTAFILANVGIVLVLNFEWFMVIFGVGFLGGGYLLMNILPSITKQDPYLWVIFVLGGIVGMCLMVIAFDWTLIMISSLLGASLIMNAFHGMQGARELLFIGSVLIGILVQYLTFKEPANQTSSARISRFF